MSRVLTAVLIIIDNTIITCDVYFIFNMSVGAQSFVAILSKLAGFGKSMQEFAAKLIKWTNFSIIEVMTILNKFLLMYFHMFFEPPLQHKKILTLVTLKLFMISMNFLDMIL